MPEPSGADWFRIRNPEVQLEPAVRGGGDLRRPGFYRIYAAQDGGGTCEHRNGRTLRELFDRYLREKTPAKGRSKQKHDRLAERVWAAFFDAQESSRRMNRHPETLDRTDWERFIEWRREGKIAGWERRVQNKQIKHDLDFLVTVLNWATGQKQDGHPILQRNPWDGSIRRAQSWVKPKVRNQKRPAMTDEVRQKLIEHSPSWQLAAALRLGRLTGRRNNAIRQLLWSDIDLQERR